MVINSDIQVTDYYVDSDWNAYTGRGLLRVEAVPPQAFKALQGSAVSDGFVVQRIMMLTGGRTSAAVRGYEEQGVHLIIHTIYNARGY